MVFTEVNLDEELTPLPKMTCTSTKCEDNLHCFRPKKPSEKSIDSAYPLRGTAITTWAGGKGTMSFVWKTSCRLGEDSPTKPSRCPVYSGDAES